MIELNLDLHVHSEASYDCQSSPEKIIETAKDRDHLDGIAITDHDSTESVSKLKELGNKEDLVIIPGTEVSTLDGHLLALNIEEEIPSGLPIKETIEKVKEAEGLSIIPHPFQLLRHGVHRSKLKQIDPDAIEAFNSRLITGFRNFQARRYAEKHGYPMTAGSDAHVPELVGNTYTRIKAESREIEDITDAIKQGRTEVKAKRTPLTSFMKQIYFNNLSLKR